MRQYGIEKWDASMPYCTNDKYPWHHFILCVVFKGADESTNHSISICNKFIFDGNLEHALKYSSKALDYCCNPPGYPSTFVGFH